jgi:hypothetical protein
MSGAIDPFKKWDENPSNPYSGTLSTGSATVSSDFVAKEFPETWKSFQEWISNEEKTSEPIGKRDERIALLYSSETERLMEKVATFVSTKLGFHVLTAPNIYRKDTGKKIAFKPYPKESLNQFIRRMIESCRLAIILYTEQGGQIIETSWCFSSLKSSLGLVKFYRGTNKPKEKEKVCPFLSETSKGLFECKCTRENTYENQIGAYICLNPRIFCHFTQQKITKMVLDCFIMSPTMRLLGSEEDDKLLEAIEPVLSKMV